MFSFITGALSWMFGNSSNGKGIVEQVSNTYDKFNPSETTRHKMNLDDQKAGDASQDSARKMILVTHESWLDILVDALNRLPRPLITMWAVGGLIGWWQLPRTGDIDPFMQNIIWTVISFWFGSRVMFKDIPNAIKVFNENKK